METFVVRVWVPAKRDINPELRGFVSHSATGRTLQFAGADELVGFLVREHLRLPAEGAIPAIGAVAEDASDG